MIDDCDLGDFCSRIVSLFFPRCNKTPRFAAGRTTIISFYPSTACERKERKRDHLLQAAAMLHDHGRAFVDHGQMEFDADSLLHLFRCHVFDSFRRQLIN